MLTKIYPKLPMRDKGKTRAYYASIGFEDVSAADYTDYLIVEREEVAIHFFLMENLEPTENYGQVYIETNAIEALYNELIVSKIPIHPNAPLTTKPWGMKEFSLLDPDHNLLTFGQLVN